MTQTETSISATEPDWNREALTRRWSPSKRLLRSNRTYHNLDGKPLARLRRKLVSLRHRFWSAITGADIPLRTQIAGGLLLPHPNGIVIHPGTEIGPNCMLLQQVTLGTNRHAQGAPRIGGHVDIGPGARILGPVTIGDHAVIEANAVDLKDVPAGATAVGIPARLLPTRDASSDASEVCEPVASTASTKNQ